MSIVTFVKRSILTANVVSVASIISVISVFSASPSQATLINGDFSSGDFTGWNTLGNTSIVNGEALLSSDNATDTDLENFLGLSAGSLDALNNINATNGSAIKQSITVNAGDVLSFDWFFQAGDYLPYNDFSFYSINSTASKLADIFQVGNYGGSGSQNSYTFQAAGTYTIGFGVLNALDTSALSNLKVDNVQLAKLTSVPEPTSLLAILTVGALSVTSPQKRKHLQKASAKA